MAQVFNWEGQLRSLHFYRISISCNYALVSLVPQMDGELIRRFREEDFASLSKLVLSEKIKPPQKNKINKN